MGANSFTKIFFAGLAAILFQSTVQARITVLSIPSWSQTTMGIGSGGYAPSWNEYGLPPEYSVTFPMPLPYSANPDSCNGIASAARSYISGWISCGLGQPNASSGATYRMNIYADVVPDSNVRVKLQANFNIDWYGFAGQADTLAGFNFYATVGENAGAQVNRVTVPYLLNGPLNNSGQQWTAVVHPPANSAFVTGGKTYYKLGMVEAIGSGALYAATANAHYNSTITGIEAYYIGKSLSKLEDTDNQTWRVNEDLPKSLSAQVGDDEPEANVSGIPITFSIIDPANGAKFSNGGTSIIVETETAGVASVGFKLGTAAGVYKIKATCPENICTSGAREVTFSATALDKTLNCVSCEWHAKPAKELPTPFRLQVIDDITGEPVPGALVAYDIIRFTDTHGNTISDPHPFGADIRVFNAVSDIYGFSRAYLKLGSEEGTYVVRARCESCTSGLEQIAYGIASAKHIEIHAEKTTEADPDDTPIVQITQVQAPNDGKSFTTSDGENRVVLQARLLPVTLDQNLIHWNTEDPDDDYITSGIAQMEASYGPSNALRMRLTSVGGGVPVAPAGRPLPLSYIVTAEATVPGKVVIPSKRTVKQDVIDKCRQEYVDYSISLNEVPRSVFTVGTHHDYSQDIKDCYAYIYPANEAQKIANLKDAGYQLKVTSGYRSPRSNNILIGATISSTRNSTHIFGQAVDMRPLDRENVNNWQELWEAGQATCPKSLERSSTQIMKLCNGASTVPYNGSFYPGLYEAMFPLATCIHLGNSSKLYE